MPAQSATPATAIRRILIPVDGSPASLEAIAYARRFSGATLLLLKVGIDLVDVLPDLVPADIDAMHNELLAELEAIAGPLRDDGVTVQTMVEDGDAAERIVAVANSEGVDLVIMTTHGRGAAGRVLFGSVADRVSRHAEVPTLLVRIGLESGTHQPERVLVTLDGSPRAEAALPIAQAIASQIGLPITLARVVTLDEALARASRIQGTLVGRPLDTTDEVLAIARREASQQAQRYLDDLAATIGPHTSALVLHGSPAVTLLQEIRSTDLVIVTSHGAHGVTRWLIGSVAEKLVREAIAPIVLVPARGQSSRSTEDL